MRSTDGRNRGLKFFCRRLVDWRPTVPLVELLCDPAEPRPGVNRQMQPSSEVPSERLIGVHVGATLPRALPIADVHGSIGAPGEALLICQFLAAIPGQCAHIVADRRGTAAASSRSQAGCRASAPAWQDPAENSVLRSCVRYWLFFDCFFAAAASAASSAAWALGPSRVVDRTLPVPASTATSKIHFLPGTRMSKL